MKRIRFEGCHHYSINEEGVVINTESGRVLKTDLNSAGYKRVTLWTKQQTRKRITVHRLVAMHYIPMIDAGKPFVNHKDGNKLNNHYFNLEWVSCKENTQHAFKNGLRKGPNRLPDHIVKVMRQAHEDGWGRKSIIEHFQLPKHQVDDVLYRGYYKDVC